MEKRFPDLPVFGKPADLQLRENLLPIHEHLKPAVVEWLQLQGRDLLLEFFQKFLRQTDGSRFILSRGTVFDLDFHRFE